MDQFNLSYSNKVTRAYNVKVTTEYNTVDGNKGDKMELKYKVTIASDPKIFTFAVNVKKEEILINKQIFPRNPLHRIMLKTAEPLNDLTVTLATEGDIKSIINHNEIVKQWRYARMYVEHGYELDKLDEILEAMERTITDKQALINALHRDPFHHFFFYKLHGSYPDKIKQRRIALIDFLQPQVIMNEQLVLVSNDRGVEITMTGENEIEPNNLLEVKSKGTYHFCNDGIITNAMVQVEGKSKERTKELTVTINETKIQ